MTETPSPEEGQPESPLEEVTDGRSAADALSEGERSALVEQRVKKGLDMAAAMSFAWGMLESEILTEQEYADVVHDLSEMSAGQSLTTVSIPHVLEARAIRNIGAIMGSIAERCGTPIIALSGFDLQLQAITLLPYDLMVRCGTIVYELLGRDALVATLAPYDEQLRSDISRLIGKKCHFFVTLPSEFDQAIERIAALLEASPDEEE